MSFFREQEVTRGLTVNALNTQLGITVFGQCVSFFPFGLAFDFDPAVKQMFSHTRADMIVIISSTLQARIKPGIGCQQDDCAILAMIVSMISLIPYFIVSGVWSSGQRAS